LETNDERGGGGGGGGGERRIFIRVKNSIIGADEWFKW
jgi:hypothetical protein